MPDGYWCLVLHAHLPYVRHPEHERFLEEQWLYEAITETYLPLLRMLEGLEADGVEYAMVLSLSPTLLTMLEDPLLQERYAERLRHLVALADRECDRRAEPAFARLARWYADRFRDTLYWFEERCGRRLAPAFRRIAAGGRLELITCGATHGFLPFLRPNPGAVRAQVHTAVEYFTSVFGAPPPGLWVPECAYYPGLEAILAEAGIRYFFVDSHGLENASEAPRYGVHAPCYTPSGVAVFGRDKETSHQVWAAEVGYPGHADYREFYRDIGYDLPAEELRDFLVAGDIRVNTGLKYYRITRDGERKEPYDPDRARELAAEHAGNFLFNRERQLDWLGPQMDRPPLIVSPYDAELFGHWWYEGPLFLDYLFRKMCYDQDRIRAITPLRYLQSYPENQELEPAASSWGAEGTYEYWMNPENDKVYAELHAAADRLTAWVDRGGGGKDRILRQMTRELLLAQASDWPFIMRSGTSPEYALKRIHTHLARFCHLESMLENDAADEEALAALEFVDRIFPDVRPGWYASASKTR